MIMRFKIKKEIIMISPKALILNIGYMMRATGFYDSSFSISQTGDDKFILTIRDQKIRFFFKAAGILKDLNDLEITYPDAYIKIKIE